MISLPDKLLMFSMLSGMTEYRDAAGSVVNRELSKISPFKRFAALPAPPPPRNRLSRAKRRIWAAEALFATHFATHKRIYDIANRLTY
jgi:hypothetical protein